MAKRKRRKKKTKRRSSRSFTARAVHEYYRSGLFHFQTGDYGSAVKAWRALLKAQPEDTLVRKLAEAHFRYALSLDRTHKLPQVISELHQAIQHAPDVAVYHYHLGLAYHRKGEYEKAVPAYQRALMLNPEDPRFQEHLSFALVEMGQDPQVSDVLILQRIRQGEHAEALRLLEQQPPSKIRDLILGIVQALQNNFVEAKRRLNKVKSPEYSRIASYYLGFIYAQERKFPSAIKHLEHAIKDEQLAEKCKPLLLGVYKQQALKYADAGDQTKAYRIWNKLAQLDPEDPAAINAIAVVLKDGYRHASEGDLSSAMRVWRRAINQGVRHAALLQNYAIACDRNERYGDAFQTWAQLAELWEQQLSGAGDQTVAKRKIALVYRRMGEIAWFLDNIDTAEAVYRKVLEYTPDDLEIHLRLIGISLEYEAPGRVFSQLRRLHRKYPDNIQILETMVATYLEEDKYEEGLDAAIKILALDPKHAPALELIHGLGCVHVNEQIEMRRGHQASRLLEKLMSVDPEYLPFHILKGKILLKRRKPEEAKSAWQHALDIAEDKAVVHAKIGSIYMFTGFPDEAETHFREAGALDSESPEVLLLIGSTYIEYNEEEADLYFEKLFNHRLGEPELFSRIATEWLELQRFSLAREILERGLEQFPEAAELGIALVLAAMMLDDFDLAQETIDRIRPTIEKSGNSEMLELLASIEMTLGFRNIFGGEFGDFIGGLFDEYDEDDEPF